jgi:hypothetical protein
MQRPARPFPSSILLDKNRRDISKSQSIWTDSKMETVGSQGGDLVRVAEVKALRVGGGRVEHPHRGGVIQHLGLRTQRHVNGWPWAVVGCTATHSPAVVDQVSAPRRWRCRTRWAGCFWGRCTRRRARAAATRPASRPSACVRGDPRATIIFGDKKRSFLRETPVKTPQGQRRNGPRNASLT